jgi:curved DNA-binding protein CbpA
MVPQNHYSTLEIDVNASLQDIKRAFHRLALRYHPDRNQGDEKAAEHFKKINEAYQILSNPEKKFVYDQQFLARDVEQNVAYLIMECDINECAVNDVITLSYSFPSEGRFFKKPVLRGFMVTAGPFVDHRTSFRLGINVKETVLTYKICPMLKGHLVIQPATINFNHKPFQGNALQFNVSSNNCFYKSNETADINPVEVFVYKEKVIETTRYRKTITQTEKVLIPRSEIAAWYHKVGKIIKITFLFCGCYFGIKYKVGFFVGAFAGSLMGGLNCHLMYYMMGIKSIFHYTEKSPKIRSYVERGYKLGEFEMPSYSIFGLVKLFNKWMT